MFQDTKAIFNDEQLSDLTIIDYLFESGMYDKCIQVYDLVHQRKGSTPPDFDMVYTAALAKLVGKIKLPLKTCNNVLVIQLPVKFNDTFQGTEDSLERAVSLIKKKTYERCILLE